MATGFTVGKSEKNPRWIQQKSATGGIQRRIALHYPGSSGKLLSN